MRIVKIKNLQDVSDIYEGVRIDAGQYYTIQNESELSKFASNAKINSHLWATPAKILISDGDKDLTPSEGDRWIKGNINCITETVPFAKPSYRTKNIGTDIEVVAAGQATTVDLYITEERYVSGGKVIVENPQFGDYFTAEVIDLDGVIPEAYRATLCENYPCVSKYVEKMWVDPNGENILDTRPLNAKISAGLYMRMTYYATAEGVDRRVMVNYDMQKALV